MEIKKTQQYGMFFILMVASLFLFIHPLYASDELYLTGIVKSIDHNTNIVVVDVKSASCRGLREFILDGPAALLDPLVGNKIDFTIDSSTCESGTKYKMFLGGRKKW